LLYDLNIQPNVSHTTIHSQKWVLIHKIRLVPCVLPCLLTVVAGLLAAIITENRVFKTLTKNHPTRQYRNSIMFRVAEKCLLNNNMELK
jgi:hypothetical protein